jgi:formate--tetrahydrofolate ligase
VQTLQGSPALVHGGPFANIAHGCNSVLATRLGLKLANIVVTEAGFGADLGGEKFLDIKCRSAGLAPACAVVVATVRALKMHGGVAKPDLGRQDVGAVVRGVVNLARHVENLGKFGLPVVVALNRFSSDTEAEIAEVVGAMARQHTQAFLCTHWSDGAAGATDLAGAVRSHLDAGQTKFRMLYADALPLADKIRCIATEIYRAADIALPPPVVKKLAGFQHAGFATAPVCIAKTQYSFTTDPTKLGAPDGHMLPVRDVRLSAGAGFVVAIAGDVMTMPGLPRQPAAEGITVNSEGQIDGLF